jgi:DNA-binding beta-propeller fold protein YncE
MRTLRLVTVAALVAAAPVSAIDLELVGRYSVPPPDGETFADAVFDRSAAEIVAHDPATQRLFVVNGAFDTIDVIDVANPAAPALLFAIDVGAGCSAPAPCGGANSVDVHDGLVAVAVEADPKTDPGFVLFLDADGNLERTVAVGAQPDMLTFTPDGRYVLTANEGEPSGYGPGEVDPEGSVSVIRIPPKPARGHAPFQVRTAGFRAFEGALPAGVRVFGPGASVAQDLEPEYVAVSADSKTAYVTLQEANAIAIVDVNAAKVKEIVPLGLKDHSLPGNGLDPTNQGATALIGNWPILGLYQPDAIAAFVDGKETFLVTANEGDVREWPGYSSPCFGASESEAIEIRDAAYVLDPTLFPQAVADALKVRTNAGNLKVSRVSGDLDGDCDFDEIHAFGARSITVRRGDGTVVWDSGDLLEQVTLAAYPDFFNASNTNHTMDNRSDDKGPEPEALAIGEAHGRRLAFAGLERIGGVMVFDLTDPTSPELLTYVNDRDFTQAPSSGLAKDLGPEGIRFIPAEESPTGVPLIAVANEISGTTSIFAVVD